MSELNKMVFSGKDIAFVIPSKDRPQKVFNVLDSLAQQSVQCGRVIVVCSGSDISEIVFRFKDCLSVEYYYSSIPGQLRQRNLGISKLNSSTKLVGFLDDDIVLKPNAIEKLISFWNKIEPETAGIGFNIVNEKKTERTYFKQLIHQKILIPGRVYKSGFNTSISDMQRPILSEWLNGGTTVWRQDILDEYKHEVVNTDWAICEDLIFSYPIGKKYPLYVCADAKVIHDHPPSVEKQNKKRQHGKQWALWHLYFVKKNRELSVSSYAFMILTLFFIGLILGIIPKYKYHSNFLRGVGKGGLHGLITILHGKDLKKYLEDSSLI